MLDVLWMDVFLQWLKGRRSAKMMMFLRVLNDSDIQGWTFQRYGIIFL
jgi:hypothetical protein